MRMMKMKKKTWMALRLVFDNHLIPLHFRLEIETLVENKIQIELPKID
jgi:hypothetical protein